VVCGLLLSKLQTETLVIWLTHRVRFLNPEVSRFLFLPPFFFTIPCVRDVWAFTLVCVQAHTHVHYVRFLPPFSFSDSDKRSFVSISSHVLRVRAFTLVYVSASVHIQTKFVCSPFFAPFSFFAPFFVSANAHLFRKSERKRKRLYS
jgi:hypothetical protein